MLFSENQTFLQDLVENSLEGNSPGFFSQKKLRKLMENESLRAYVVTKLNTTIDKPVIKDYVDDVEISNKKFNSIGHMLKTCIAGLEDGIKSHNFCGMASVFMLLEIAYTRYQLRNVNSAARLTKEAGLKKMEGVFDSASKGISFLAASMTSEQGTVAPSMMSLNIKSPLTDKVFDFANQVGKTATPFKSLASVQKPIDSENGRSDVLHSYISSDSNEDSGFAEKNEGQQLAKQKTLDGATMHFTTTKSHYEHEAYRPRITVEGVSNQAFSYKHGQNQDLLTEVDAKRRQMEQMRKDSSLSSDTTSPLLSNSSDVHACDSDVSVSSGNETPLSYVQRRISHHSIRSNFSDSDVDISQIGKKHNIPQAASSVVTSEINSVKSVFSKGFRYNCGSLIKIPNVPSPEDNTRKYLFELLIEKDRSPLWDNLQFWEDCYLDAIAAERDAMGMDQSPCDMIERYKHLHDGEKKRLDEEEDRLLAAVLFNMIAFMLSMGVNKRDIRKKVRRLLGRSHIGLSSSHEINECLDIIQYLNGNDVDLKPLLSRQIHKQTFVVHSGTDTTGDVLFLEVCEDCIVIRNGSGAVFEKLYYEKLINMSYSPKAKVLCLWRLRHMDSTLLSKFYTKKCKELYYRIKESMERAASKRPLDDKVPELGGEFPIQDVKTEQYGKLHITLDGIGFKFDTFKYFIELKDIKKCNTKKGMFILHEYVASRREMVVRKYRSPLSNEICYAVLCVFSYVAAASKNSSIQQPPPRQQSRGESSQQF